MKKIFSLILTTLAMMILFTGCGGSTKKNAPIILGFLPNESVPESKEFREGIAAELKEATGKEIEIRRTDSYEALIDAMLAGEIHMTMSGGAQYIMAKDDYMGGDNIEVLLTYAPSGDMSKAGYKGWIATKKGSKLQQEIEAAGIEHDLTPGGGAEKARMEMLKGKRFGFVSYSSTSGFVVPRSILYGTFGAEGLGLVEDKDDFADPSKVNFMDITTAATGDHQGSANAVYNEVVDAGAFCCGNYFGQRGVDADGIEDYYILAERLVPNEPIWVNVDAVGKENIEKIRGHFDGLGYEGVSEAGKKIWEGTTLLENKEDRFVTVDDSFYQVVREL